MEAGGERSSCNTKELDDEGQKRGVRTSASSAPLVLGGSAGYYHSGGFGVPPVDLSPRPAPFSRARQNDLTAAGRGNEFWLMAHTVKARTLLLAEMAALLLGDGTVLLGMILLDRRHSAVQAHPAPTLPTIRRNDELETRSSSTRELVTGDR